MITLELNPQTAEKISALAAASGMTVDAYLQSLLPSSANGSTPKLSLAELESLLNQHAFDGPTLPSDFSRADIYGEHD